MEELNIYSCYFTGDGATVGVTIDGFGGSITQTGSGYTPGVYLNIPVISSGSGTGATIDLLLIRYLVRLQTVV